MASDIRDMRNMIRAAILAAQKDDAPCIVGPECRDCSARAYCTTLQRASLAAVDESGRPTPMELPPEAMGLEMRMLSRALDRMKARLSGLEEVAISKVKSGTLVPGFRLQNGQGRERWKVDVAAVESLGELMGLKLTQPKPITPKQAIKAGLPRDVAAEFTETPTGAVTLVEDDGSLARRVFGGV